MQTKFTKYFNYTLLIIFMGVLSAGVFLTSCEKDEEGDNGVTVLNSFGPTPVARGGELRFIGKNLDKVTAVVLPGDIVIDQFGTKTSELITITVPQNAIEGLITLKSPDGDITTKTLLGFSEPISIASFSPTQIRTDSILTITGDYLNLVHEIIFADGIAVGDTDFITHTRNEISLPVPAEAQTGLIAVSNGKTDPIVVKAVSLLTVKLPVITALSPNPVKAGTELVITGDYLDLVKKVTLGGGISVSDFNATKNELKFTVPADTKEGKVALQPASDVYVYSSDDLKMVVPTVSVFPTELKNGTDITVTGTNLDLVNTVTFNNNQSGTIKSKNTDGTQMIVTSPLTATDGIVKFTTKANITVNGPSLTFVKPTITSLSSLSVKTNDALTITGENLDLIASVKFAGGTSTVVKSPSATSFTVKVPYSSLSGKITLVAKNGVEIESADVLNVSLIVPTITTVPEYAYLGSIVSISGTGLDLASEIIFPGDITATIFSVKSATMVQVYVPMTVTRGIGKITFKTINGEITSTPNITFKKTDVEPVADASLVFFNFDGLNSWWTNVGGVNANDPALSLDGTNYFRVNSSGATGWKAIFARNGGNNFPGAKVGTDVANYSIKFEINIMTAISDAAGAVAIRLQGTEGDFFYNWAPWKSAPYKTEGWLTVTIPLSDFKDNYGYGTKQITDLSKINQEFGFIWNNSTTGPALNLCFDNVRLHKNN